MALGSAVSYCEPMGILYFAFVHAILAQNLGSVDFLSLAYQLCIIHK